MECSCTRGNEPPGSIKWRGISWLTEDALASHEGLCSMKFVRCFLSKSDRDTVILQSSVGIFPRRECCWLKILSRNTKVWGTKLDTRMSNIQRKCGFPAQKGVGYPWTNGTVAPSSTVQVATKKLIFFLRSTNFKLLRKMRVKLKK